MYHEQVRRQFYLIHAEFTQHRDVKRRTSVTRSANSTGTALAAGLPVQSPAITPFTYHGKKDTRLNNYG